MFRRSRISTMVALVTILAVALAGCGPSDGDSGQRAGHGGTITVTHDPGDGAPTTTITVDCHTQPALCTALSEIAQPAPGALCTSIYGGPETFTLDGTYGDRRVDFTVGRANGCDIATYDAIANTLSASQSQ